MEPVARGSRGAETKPGRAFLPALALALALFACTRDYESPYVPGSNSYAGDDWTRDGDGDGVADSVAKYAPVCSEAPKECIENAKVSKTIGPDYSLSAADMIIWEGTGGYSPRLSWEPSQAALRGYVLSSSDTAKVKIRDGRLDAVGVGNAQVSVNVPGESRMASFLARVVPRDGRRVKGISAGNMVIEAGKEQLPEIRWDPADADYREYRLTVDVPSVGWPVNGAIKAIFAGEARVTVEALDGGHKAAFNLRVTSAPVWIEAVSVAAEDMYLVAGDSAEAPVIHWNPANVTEKRYLLAPVDTQVAGVNQERDRIVPVAKGKTQVNLYSLDGGNRTAYFTVYVVETAVKVQGLAAADMRLAVGGDPAAPRLTWSPADATNRKYTLASDSPHVAAVDGNLIVPVSLGRAFLRATSADGGYHAGFLVDVLPQDTTVHVDSIHAADMSLTVGFQRAPVLTWYPEDVGNQEYSLASSDPAVAAVNGSLVRGVAPGGAVVTVTTSDGGRTAAFTVNVGAAHIPAQRVQGEPMDMVEGEIESPALSWYPGNATSLSYSLTSSNPGVARIVDSISVEAVAVGAASVIIRSKDGPADTIQVTVNAKAIPVTGIAVAAFAHNVGDPDKDVTSLIQWAPANATNKAFKLISTSNTAAAAVADNKVRAVASGTSSIVIESQDAGRLKATFIVTVRQPVKGLVVRDTAVWPGSPDIDPSPLVAWTPSNADNKGFLLTSLDTLVASVVGGNKLKPRASGAAHVILRSLDNTARLDTFKVTVKVPVKSLAIRDTTVYVGMKLINPLTLVTWNPANATDKNWHLTWAGASSNTIVDSVTWRFNAVGPGKVNLVFNSASNPAAKDTFQVTVIQPLIGISASHFTMTKGDADREPAITWNPANASNKGYTLSGGNANVATVAGNKVRAVGGGSAAFTVTASEGGKVATFTVTVNVPVVSINAHSLEIRVGDADAAPEIDWTPADATNKGYTMTSDDPETAAIVNGKIRAVSRGTATVTVTSNDGQKKDNITVTVRNGLGF